MFIEPEVEGDPFEVSDADTMLRYINPKAQAPAAVAIITKSGCPFCARAKKMLEERNMPYEEIVLGRDATLRSLRAITASEMVPQVFINGDHIGGSDDLAEYFAKQ
jgi:glutaredoxin-like protein